MTSTVHYKFKRQKDYDSLGFDGMFISVGDLKRQIAEKKGLAGDRNMELQLTNAQNDEEYADDSTMVWKNTSVIVKRVPVARPGAVGSEVGSTTEKKVVYVAPPQPLPAQPHHRRRPYGHPQHTGSMTWTADGANTPADGDKEPADASIAALVSDDVNDDEAKRAQEGRDDLQEIPPQLYFVHQGQSDIKEVHWHPQLPGVVGSTALDSFHMMKPANTGDGPA